MDDVINVAERSRDVTGVGRAWRDALSGWNAEKIAPRVLAGLVIYVVARTVLTAASTPFWYDELITWAITRQPSLSAMWNLLKRGADEQPLGFYLTERAFAAWVPNEHIGFRLPSIIAFAVILVAVFVFVRRRSGSGIALVCATVPLLTSLYSTYATEARPYSLFVACVAVALVCYQRAPAGGWMLAMGLSLALAESFHYYAVFALVPFMVAEGVLSLNTRRLRPAVWLALLCGVAPLVASWRLLWRLKAHAGPQLWARPTLHHLSAVVGSVLHLPPALGAALVAAMSLGAFAGILFLAVRGIRGNPTAIPFFHELVLVSALLALPVIVFGAMEVMRGAFTGRYALPALLGLPLALGYILPWLQRRSAILAAILVLFFLSAVMLGEKRFWSSDRPRPSEVTSATVFAENLVGSVGYTDLPVVVSNGLDYVVLAHYASPDWAKRFVALVDEPESVIYAGSDAVDNGLIFMKSYLPLRVFEFRAFASQHPIFLLYSGDASTQFDWWPTRLRQDGDSLRELAAGRGRRVYLVNLKRELP